MAEQVHMAQGAGVLVVAAHPDDETIGCGGVLGETRHARIAYLTDGVPRDPYLRPATFGQDAERYRAARTEEARRALALVGIGDDHVLWLGAVDQETSYAMVPLALRLLGILEDVRPRVVVTHPYEGGHPDHDTAAFLARAACNLYCARHGYTPAMLEMTSYHASSGNLVTGAFLAERDRCARRDAFTLVLGPDQRRRKELMMQCFATQKGVLAPFGVECERFRRAPRYDFSRAPHGGSLYYEQLGWPLSGARWRALAQEAERHLRSP